MPRWLSHQHALADGYSDLSAEEVPNECKRELDGGARAAARNQIPIDDNALLECSNALSLA